MFGRKAAQIRSLKFDLEYARGLRDKYFNQGVKAQEALARKTSELTILQDAFRRGVVVTEELRIQIAQLQDELLAVQKKLKAKKPARKKKSKA